MTQPLMSCSWVGFPLLREFWPVQHDGYVPAKDETGAADAAAEASVLHTDGSGHPVDKSDLQISPMASFSTMEAVPAAFI